MEILSSIKPDIPKKPEVKIEYNDRTYQSYMDTGFGDLLSPGSSNKAAHYVNSPRNRILKFLNECDIRKGPVERTVTSMFRLKAIDGNSPKQERKEFIWYEERWEGKNWLGVPVNPIDGHIEGKYNEVVTTPKLDERTGTHVENLFAGTRECYYIPWSKSNVDEILANSAHSDKSGIRYTIMFDMADSPETFTLKTRNYFSYDQFANWSWEKLREYHYWPVDDLISRPKAFKSANKLEFKPS